MINAYAPRVPVIARRAMLPAVDLAAATVVLAVADSLAGTAVTTGLVGAAVVCAFWFHRVMFHLLDVVRDERKFTLTVAAEGLIVEVPRGALSAWDPNHQGLLAWRDLKSVHRGRGPFPDRLEFRGGRSLVPADYFEDWRSSPIGASLAAARGPAVLARSTA